MKTPFYSFFRRCMNRSNDKCFGVVSSKPFVDLIEEQAPMLLRLFTFKSEEEGCINTVSDGSRTNTFWHYPPVEETGDLIGGLSWSGLFVEGDVPELLIQMCMCRILYDFERIDFDGGFMMVPKEMVFESLHICGKPPRLCECFVR